MQERPVLTPQQVNRDLLAFSQHTPGWFWIAVGVLGLGVGAGGLCVVLMVAYGLGLLGYTNTQLWTVLITNFVFWVGISHAGVMISAVLRLSHAEWRRPITRAAEVLTVFALMAAAIFPVIHTGRMWRAVYWFFPYDFSRNLWPSVRSALVWDVTAILTYLTGTALFVYVALLPDLAVMRDQATGGWRRFYGALALGFTGTTRQWKLQRLAGPLIAALILPVFVSVHSTVAWDFSVAIVPGWHSTIFGPYFVIGAVHSGVGAMVLVMALLRRAFHLETYITPEHFDAMGRLQIAVALGWIFFWLVDFFFGIFAREPVELRVWELRLLTWPNSALALVFIVTAFVIPFPLWLFRSVRRAPLTMALLGVSVNIGMWLERYLLIVPPLSFKQAFVFTWVGSYQPRLIEYVVTFATFAFVALGVLLFARLFPIIPLWDVKEGQVVRREIKIGRARVPAVVRE
jgi:Ni/Fe-hydrogenase subunit HybB-like protein